MLTYIFSVFDAAGESVIEWQQLRRFWENYLKQAGARVQRYSAFRDQLELERYTQFIRRQAEVGA